MQFSLLISTLAVAFIGSATAASPAVDARGARPCNFSNPSEEEGCPPRWPKCIKFRPSCISNCAGICVSNSVEMEP
ncbi:hypothetical protein B0T14DRAFT_507935 [Immersiella caudata]|uniref:Uncharacterized protein n=1 Tax=Immersiella caudata TaxID=314043 RepID=A0AA39XHL9_9PEZI|nr:hypothetical protein B0T14DRAFT_507935 [Immersiella caudata]